jgi:hypothetical protein
VVRLALLVVVLVGACAAPDHQNGVLDELQIPTGWELAATRTTGTGGDQDCAFFLPKCPHVARYYLTDMQAIDAYAAAKQMLAAAGFKVDEEFDPDCAGNAAACVVVASRDSDTIQVSVYGPGEDPDGLGMAQQDRSMIRVTAEAK